MVKRKTAQNFIVSGRLTLEKQTDKTEKERKKGRSNLSKIGGKLSAKEASKRKLRPEVTTKTRGKSGRVNIRRANRALLDLI